MATFTVWLLILAGVLVGALLGGAIALFVLRRGGPDSGSLRHEFDDYRREVAEHYAETANRVDALTHAYKAVYDHLEDGAYRLVGENELRRRLEDTAHEPITIEGIGQRVLQRPSDGDSAQRDEGGQTEERGASDDAADQPAETPSEAAERRT